MSIEFVMPSNHLILCHPLLLPPSVFPSIRVFSNESVICIRGAKFIELEWMIELYNMIFIIFQVLEKTLESPLDYKEIKPINLKGNQSCLFTGRTDAEDEAPILWPPDVKSWPIKKDPDAGKDWWQEEKGRTEDKKVGWHHQLNWHAFAQALGDGDGQGSLACCSQWGCKELDTTEQLNNNKKDP